MDDSKRTRNIRILMSILVIAGIIGCLVEMRAANLREAELTKQGLMGEMTESSITGGRARGGTFNRPAPSTPSDFGGGGYSRSPRSRDYGGTDYYTPRQTYPRGGGVVVPVPSAPYPGYVPTPSYYGTGGGAGMGIIFLLLVLGFMILPVIVNLIKLKAVNSSGSSSASQRGELYNDVVTVTQIQVALLASARSLQSDLTELTERSNLETQAGLSQMLQETVLALLRFPEYWSYAKVNSQTVPSREQAGQVFEQLSIQERSKYKTETLVNIGGQIRRQTTTLPQTDESPAYIVVTLLVGTADDKPIIGSVHSAEELKAALQRLGAITPDYLMVYELIWSPQDSSESLTYDGLLANYPDLTLIG